MLIKSRILAFAIDYLFIAAYGLIVFGIVNLLTSVFAFEKIKMHPLQWQFVGFITMTLPVFLYFFLSENGKHRATIGKRILKIQVENLAEKGLKIFIRNLLKFLPWEIAHTGVHWINYYSSNNLESPPFVWMLLIIPQVIVIIYFISIFISKGERSIYDIFSKTRVIKLENALE